MGKRRETEKREDAQTASKYLYLHRPIQDSSRTKREKLKAQGTVMVECRGECAGEGAQRTWISAHMDIGRSSVNLSMGRSKKPGVRLGGNEANDACQSGVSTWRVGGRRAWSQLFWEGEADKPFSTAPQNCSLDHTATSGERLSLYKSSPFLTRGMDSNRPAGSCTSVLASAVCSGFCVFR